MPSWRPSCAASARAVRNGIVSSARCSRWRVSRRAARTASAREPRVEHDRDRVAAGTSSPTQSRSRAVGRCWRQATVRCDRAGAERNGGSTPRKCRRSSTNSSRSVDAVAAPAAWTRDVRAPHARVAASPSVRPLTVHDPAPRARALSPAYVSTRASGASRVSATGASCAGLGLGFPRPPGRRSGRDPSSVRRGLSSAGRAGAGRAGRTRGRTAGHAYRDEACVRRRSGGHTPLGSGAAGRPRRGPVPHRRTRLVSPAIRTAGRL